MIERLSGGCVFKSHPGQIFSFLFFSFFELEITFFCLHSSKVVLFNFQKKHNIVLLLAFRIHGLAHRSL